MLRVARARARAPDQPDAGGQATGQLVARDSKEAAAASAAANSLLRRIITVRSSAAAAASAGQSVGESSTSLRPP